MLHPKVHEQMEAIHANLEAEGSLLSAEALRRCYGTFRQRFGPDILSRLEGQELLDVLKGPGKEGLVYWLEFKDDEELPARFGSIAGGSALKYGVYRRRETGTWMTGSSIGQREISTADAIAIATGHRNQLLAASELLDTLNQDQVDDADYIRLQRELQRVAPDVQDSAWGRKYLSLIHPDELDDFHSAAYQRYHLIKTLEEPTQEEGRYTNAGRFVRLAREFGWVMKTLTGVMHRRNGAPHRYWRVGTRSAQTNQSHWDMMRERSVIAIGWPDLGDLSSMRLEEDFRERLKRVLADKYPNDPTATGRAAQQIFNFARTFEPRD